MTVSGPVLQKISARLLIPSGWIIGTFHVPVSMDFVEFLDGAGPFFKLTNVTLAHHNEPVEFFALRCDEVSLIIAEEEDSKLNLEAPGPRSHAVSCLLPTGDVVGTLDVDAELRVSDYLMHHQGFATLRNCVGRDKHAAVNAASVVFVNARGVVGVVDRHFD